MQINSYRIVKHQLSSHFMCSKKLHMGGEPGNEATKRPAQAILTHAFNFLIELQEHDCEGVECKNLCGAHAS